MTKSVKGVIFGRPAKVSFRPLVIFRRVFDIPSLNVSVPPGGTIRAAVKWENTGNVDQFFDIDVKYYYSDTSEYAGGHLVPDVASTPGQIQTTNVDMLLAETQKPGDLDAVVSLYDETGTLQDQETYTRVVTVTTVVSARIISTVFSSV